MISIVALSTESTNGVVNVIKSVIEIAAPPAVADNDALSIFDKTGGSAICE